MRFEMGRAVFVVAVVACAMATAVVVDACSCKEGEFAVEEPLANPVEAAEPAEAVAAGPLGRDDDDKVVVEETANPDRDRLPPSLEGDTAANDSPGFCVCRRARKPARRVRCDKPGTHLHTEGPTPAPHDPCKEDVSLLPEVGKEAIKLVGKLGFHTLTANALRSTAMWAARWSDGVVDALARVTTIPHHHIAIPRITHGPTTADFSIAVNNDLGAAELVVAAVNDAVASGEFDEILATHGFPENTTTTVLSIAARKIPVYEPERHKTSLLPLGPLRARNHTRANRTAPATLLPSRSVVVKSGNRTARPEAEEVPLVLRNGVPIDKRCGRPKQAPKLLVPPVARGDLVAVPHDEHPDSARSDLDSDMATAPDRTGNLPTVPPPSRPLLWDHLETLEGAVDRLNAKENDLLDKIAELQAKLPEDEQ